MEKLISVERGLGTEFFTINKKENVVLVTNVNTGTKKLLSLNELDKESVSYFKDKNYTDFVVSLIQYGIIN